MHKPTIGVFFGSRSAEHDVSVITAIASVIKPLRATNKYTVVPVYISKDGKWYTHEKLANIATYQTGDIEVILKKNQPLSVEFGHGLTLVSKGLRPKRTHIGIAFPATHGTNGEDGALMGVFEMAGIPYVGCDVAASAIAMNKVMSKLIAKSAGVHTPKFHYLSKEDFEKDPEKSISQLLSKSELKKAKLPFFVKPAHLGSSIGITRVEDSADLKNAIEVAAHYDDLIIIEEGVQNLIEVTVPVLGNNDPRVALVERPKLQADDFFDFDSKYLNNGGKKGGQKSAKNNSRAQGYSELPAKLDKEMYRKCEETALTVYGAIGCQGTARVDLLIDSKTKQVYFNEINPLPGSLYLHNWQKAGVSAVHLVTSLVDLALERHAKKSATTTTFETNYLKQF